MPATIPSAAIVGINAAGVDVAVDIIPGLPKVTVVGLPDTAVQESRERVRSAVRNSGFEFPLRRVTISLSPAELRKEGSGFDLPTALALLVASRQIPNVFARCCVIGELNLEGTCLPVAGAIAYAEYAVQTNRLLILPRENAGEAALIPGVRLVPVDSVASLAALALAGALVPTTVPPTSIVTDQTWNIWPAIRGQIAAKRAAVIAATGGHNLLLIGPPGSGKTLLCEGLHELLPDLPIDQAVEVRKIASVAGVRRPHDPFRCRPPLRRPHHSASVAALVGGGRQPRPGELTLAHRGVLFLDEFAEFSRDHLEALRQPLENGTVVVSRVAGTMEFPAAMMLVAAMNPCPCGFAGDASHPCHCSPSHIARYLHKISGPILDRFDLSVTLTRVQAHELDQAGADDPRPRIQAARARAATRPGGPWPVRQRGQELLRSCQLDTAATDFLRLALDRWQLSLRAHDRVLRVARTIADLGDCATVTTNHLAEAIQYRPPSILQPNRTTAG